MPEPSSDLLTVARELADGGTAGARLKRAVSTAYHAVFHKISYAAAQRFLGAGREATGAYAILYRSFDHRHLKTVCMALQASTLTKKFRVQLRRGTVSQDIRDFATAFPKLQEARHLADYDPAVDFPPDEVASLIDSADAAIAAFDRAAPEEQIDVLALMMVRARD